MSHEIRTPHERHHRHDRAGPRHRARLRSSASTSSMVKASAESLLTVINDILDFSKIEAGKLDLEAIDFDLRDSLGDTMKAARPCGPTRRGWNWPATSPPTCRMPWSAIPRRLRQVIINLVGNAIKFTEHGEVVVRVETRIADGGPGLLALRRQRHRHRHSRREAAAGSSRPSPRPTARPRAVRRHRAGPDDLGAAGRDDGRADLGRERSRPGQHVPLHRAVWACRRSGNAGRRQASRSTCTTCPCWSWTTTPPTGASSRRC